MSDQHDNWLWNVGNHEEQPMQGALSDDVLVRYRRGELSEGETLALERRLSTDTAARRRLAHLASVEIPVPQRVRERLFGAANGTRDAAIGRWRWLRVAAAVTAALVVPLCVWRLGSVPSESTDSSTLATASVPRYSISTRALAEVRSSATGTRAFPDTVVELELLPDESSVVETEIALYRTGMAQIERIPDSLLIASERRGNAVRFRIRARDLVGTAPGIHAFYVVIAQRGALPQALPDRSLEAHEGDSPSSGGWRVYRHTLEVITQ